MTDDEDARLERLRALQFGAVWAKATGGDVRVVPHDAVRLLRPTQKTARWLDVSSVDAAALEVAALLEPAVSWDFEAGLLGWSKTGTAFDRQPTFGDNVVFSRLGGSFRLGGDYWDTPTSVGHQGSLWIGTYEARPSASIPAGTIQGDRPTGTLTSRPFLVRHGVIDFLIAGGRNVKHERIELVVDGKDFDALLAGETPPGRSFVDRYRSPVKRDGHPPDARDAVEAVGARDALGVPVRTASGENDERLRRAQWRVGGFRGCRARIRIVDAGSGSWDHINVDDIRFHD
jgi:hypothetical protein